VADRDKAQVVDPIQRLVTLGFKVYATGGTAKYLLEQGIPTSPIRKQHEGASDGVPTTVEAIMNGEIDLVVNTPYGTGARRDGYEIRLAAVLTGTASITTIQGLIAAVEGIESLHRGPLLVKSIQEHVAELNALLVSANELATS